jgi:hypothetical protein
VAQGNVYDAYFLEVIVEDPLCARMRRRLPLEIGPYFKTDGIIGKRLSGSIRTDTSDKAEDRPSAYFGKGLIPGTSLGLACSGRVLGRNKVLVT